MLAICDPGANYGDRQAHVDGNTDCMPERGWQSIVIPSPILSLDIHHGTERGCYGAHGRRQVLGNCITGTEDL